MHFYFEEEEQNNCPKQINGLLQEGSKSYRNKKELGLSCDKPSIRAPVSLEISSRDVVMSSVYLLATLVYLMSLLKDG